MNNEAKAAADKAYNEAIAAGNEAYVEAKAAALRAAK